jgi:hypothetical protein
MEYSQPERIEQPKKDRTLLNILLAGCGCLLLIGAASIIFFWRFWIFAKAPARVVRSHLEAINEGNYEMAYSRFASHYKNGKSLDEFRTEIRTFSSLLPFKDMNLNNVNVKNDQASVDGTLTGRDGAIFPVHYELTKERGEWRIRSFEWTSPGARQTVFFKRAHREERKEIYS